MEAILLVSFLLVLLVVLGIAFNRHYRIRRYQTRLAEQLHDLHINSHFDQFSSAWYLFGFMQDLNLFVLQAIIE